MCLILYWNEIVTLEKNYKIIFLWKKWGPNQWFCSREKSSKSLKKIFFMKKNSHLYRYNVWKFVKNRWFLRYLSFSDFKGYLCYKMCHLGHRLRIFLFCRKIMFRSQDVQVFVFLNISWFTESSVTSQWVLVHETGCIFEYIFWTTGH